MCWSVNSIEWKIIQFCTGKVFFLHYFILKKSDAEARQFLIAASGASVLCDKECNEWVYWYKERNFDIPDKKPDLHQKVIFN